MAARRAQARCLLAAGAPSESRLQAAQKGITGCLPWRLPQSQSSRPRRRGARRCAAALIPNASAPCVHACVHACPNHGRCQYAGGATPGNPIQPQPLYRSMRCSSKLKPRQRSYLVRSSAQFGHAGKVCMAWPLCAAVPAPRAGGVDRPGALLAHSPCRRHLPLHVRVQAGQAVGAWRVVLHRRGVLVQLTRVRDVLVPARMPCHAACFT